MRLLKKHLFCLCAYEAPWHFHATKRVVSEINRRIFFKHILKPGGNACRLHVNVQTDTSVSVTIRPVRPGPRSAQRGKLGRRRKKALCLGHRSDYLPSFHRAFKANNRGFVFDSHARPLRPENTGENQNRRERDR